MLSLIVATPVLSGLLLMVALHWLFTHKSGRNTPQVDQEIARLSLESSIRCLEGTLAAWPVGFAAICTAFVGIAFQIDTARKEADAELLVVMKTLALFCGAMLLLYLGSAGIVNRRIRQLATLTQQAQKTAGP